MKPFFLLSACRIVLAAVFLFPFTFTCAAEEPEGLPDMLAFVCLHSEKEPEKALELYRNSGDKGREALIRTYFDFYPHYSYHNSVVRQACKKPPHAFVEKVSADDAFLKTMLTLSLMPAPTTPARSCELAYALALRHNPALFLDWLTEESVSGRRPPEEGWRACLEAKPEETFARLLVVLEKTMPEVQRHGTYPYYWLNALLRQYKEMKPYSVLTPAQKRLAFANRLDGNVFAPWKLDPADWLKENPDDFGLALWQENDPRRPNKYLPAEMDEKNYPRSAVKPSKDGRVMIFFDRSKAQYGDTCCRLDWALMQKILPGNVAAKSLVRYDRQIVIALTPHQAAPYNRTSGGLSGQRIDGVQWKMTVTYSNLRGGKKLAEKTFIGGLPPFNLRNPSPAMTYAEGSLPWPEVEQFIAGLFAQPEKTK